MSFFFLSLPHSVLYFIPYERIDCRGCRRGLFPLTFVLFPFPCTSGLTFLLVFFLVSFLFLFLESMRADSAVRWDSWRIALLVYYALVFLTSGFQLFRGFPTYFAVQSLQVIEYTTFDSPCLPLSLILLGCFWICSWVCEHFFVVLFKKFGLPAKYHKSVNWRHNWDVGMNLDRVMDQRE